MLRGHFSGAEKRRICAEYHILLLAGALMLFTGKVWTQGAAGKVDTLLLEELKEITVAAPRLPQTDLKSPQSVSVIGRPLLQKGQPQLTADEALQYVPGLFALNAHNYAQDLRVSIRGFGARSAFGIRGIKLLVDGLPETTPDGQAQVDNLDLGMMERVEVIRGPSSGLYGNASGGVISYYTEDAPDRPFAEARLTFGSYDLQRYQLKTGFSGKKVGFLLHGSRTTLDGYRVNSAAESNLINGKLTYQISPASNLKVLFNYLDSPVAEDPGGINLEQAKTAPSSARDRNLSFRAGEAISQGKLGLVYNLELPKEQSLQANAYYIFRDFASFLPFEGGGRVKFDRSFWGSGFSHLLNRTVGKAQVQMRTGVEFAGQTDDRTRFDNLMGQEGNKTLDQAESFNSIGFFHVQEWQLLEKLQLRGALRYETIRIEAEDRFLSNGDDSGSQDLNSLNPSIGLNLQISKALYGFATISTSFETPTLTELSNNPAGSGGFNPNLDPQRSTNYEIGVKGLLQSRFKYELALFRIRVKDELIPFELEDFPGRTFYRNAGQSIRNGVEISSQYNFARGWNAFLQYSYSDFKYDDFRVDDERLDGNQLPGIPKHAGFFGLSYSGVSGFFTNIQLRYVGELFANDSNTVTDDAYALLNLRLGYQKAWGNFVLTPFFGLNNALDASYNSNIRINAFGSRFFEPAPEINAYGGVKARLQW